LHPLFLIGFVSEWQKEQRVERRAGTVVVCYQEISDRHFARQPMVSDENRCGFGVIPQFLRVSSRRSDDWSTWQKKFVPGLR
jgi:hypothetical protein